MANAVPSVDLHPVPTAPGTVLADKYRVERVLGQGGMGVVVQARHIALDERVALKFLLPEYAHHPEAAARFLREARAAVRIKSEHVAHVTDVGTLSSGAPYMVMELLEGADLSRVLEKTGVLSVSDAVDYVIQACDAIAEAHGLGIVHRDIKPANLFLGKRPNGSPLVKVLDFGISKVMEHGVDNLTKTTAAMGSALYMSPEQMQQTRAVDHRTDIYALGISLYELLAGRQPFYADTMPQLCAEIFTGIPTPIRELRPEVSAGLAEVMEKAYARDRALRHQTVAEFVIALAPYAPPASQAMIESVCRLANLDAPKAGQAGAPKVLVGGGTQMMSGGMPGVPAAQAYGRGPLGSQPMGQGVPQLAGAAAPQPVGPAGPQPVGRMGPQPVGPHGYAQGAYPPAPAGVAQGAQPAYDEPTTIPVRSNAGVFVVLGMVGVLALGGGALFLMKKAKATPAADDTPAAATAKATSASPAPSPAAPPPPATPVTAAPPAAPTAAAPATPPPVAAPAPPPPAVPAAPAAPAAPSRPANRPAARPAAPIALPAARPVAPPPPGPRGAPDVGF